VTAIQQFNRRKRMAKVDLAHADADFSLLEKLG
jgi:hypothetical protein